jgi:alcohol dehydrogenase
MSDFAVMRAPAQVLFGTGMAAAVGPVAAGFGRRCMVCTDPTIATTDGFATVRAALEGEGLDVTVFDAGAVDVPTTTIDAAVAAGRDASPDVVVAVGGGSVVDLAKATALLLSHEGPLERYYPVGSVPGAVLPLIALPTTAGTGSEVTPVSVITDAKTGMKVGIASPWLVPRHAICDPLLTIGAPPTVTAHAGIDALSHAVEALMAASVEASPGFVLERPQVGKNLLSDGFAAIAARNLSRNLVRAVEDGADVEARAGMLYGSLLAGLAFANSGVSAAHALQFAVGAATHTSHGLGTGLLLPYVMEYNRPARPRELAELAEIMGCEDAVEHVHALGRSIGLPASLAELGLEREDLRGLAEQSVGIRRLIDNNPRPLDVDALEEILAAAWHGEPSRLSATVL